MLPNVGSPSRKAGDSRAVAIVAVSVVVVGLVWLGIPGDS